MSQNTSKHSIRYLSKNDIKILGGASSQLYVNAVSRALQLHAKGDFVQPLKPYLRANGKDGHIADRIIAMPAYLGDDLPISGLKWIGSKHDNPMKRDMERASGIIILNDSETNYPIAIMEASLISAMRTAAVTVIGTRYLARENFSQITCLGCGLIAKMQLISMLEQFKQIRKIHLFDLNQESAKLLAKKIQSQFEGVEISIAQSAEEAVRQGEVIITATVTDQPYIPFEWIQKGAFISNISIMDVQKDVFLNADKVVVDDWDQANREKKIINQLVLEGEFSYEDLHAELGEILLGKKSGRESEDEIIILNPMGMAIEDISSAHEIYRKAITEQIGTSLSLY